MADVLDTELSRDAGIDIPVICGPMYPCSNVELVAAASAAGGLGVVQPVTLTYVFGLDFREGLRAIRSITDRPIGMNALSQAREFNKSVPLTGLVITKLDGTAKGGVIVGLADEFGIPVKHVGVGETVEDLRDFSAEEFVEALFAQQGDSPPAPG